MTSVYLDVCCLNRPFDDQTQDRVRLETAAIVGILRRIELDELISVSSEAVQDEVDKIHDEDRRARIQEFIALSSSVVEVTREHLARAAVLQKLGFGPFDGLHIACAEAAGVEVFLTTDDRLIRLALRINNRLMVRVANPVIWLLEVQDD